MTPIKGMPGWAKDPATGAVVNTDSTQLDQAKKRKAQRMQKKLEEENRISKLEDEIKELKALLMAKISSS